jgi:hypothetical protein
MLLGGPASALSAQGVDDFGNTYLLPVESINAVPNFDWLTQIVLRLPDSVGATSTLRVSVGANGVKSNGVSISLSRAGGL